MLNKKPFKALALLLVPSALLMLSPLAIAETPSVPKQPPASIAGKVHTEQEARQHFAAQLGLSPEQSQKVDALMSQGHQQSQALKEQLHTKRQAMMQYLQTPNASQSQALVMNADINALQGQLSEMRVKTFFAMRALLTPEQLQKLQQIKKRDGMGPEGSHDCWHHGESGHPMKPESKPAG